MLKHLGTPLALLESGTAEWLSILVFIFGGCCSNVWALEAVLRDHPNSGTFLTFAQIVYVALQNLGGQVYLDYGRVGSAAGGGDDGNGATREHEGAESGRVSTRVNNDSAGQTGSTVWNRVPRVRIRRREVPIWKWGVQVALFLGVSLLNNYAFAFKIPLTLHIIFRSGGLCVSMFTGWVVAGKRYSVGQVLAGLVITAGIVLATLSAPSRRSSPRASTETASSSTAAVSTDTSQFITGVLLLAIALFLSALLGLWQERIYARYGKVWREGLFYSHILSIPFFAPLHSSISTTFNQYASTPPVTIFALPTMPDKYGGIGTGGIGRSGGGGGLGRVPNMRITMPGALAALAINVVTQGFCIRGVNKLTAAFVILLSGAEWNKLGQGAGICVNRVNSTTVNLVLTVRKAVSLGLSVWYYGSGATPGLIVGGAMVLGGTVLYSLAPPPRRIQTSREKESRLDGQDSGGARAEARGVSGVSGVSGVGGVSETSGISLSDQSSLRQRYRQSPQSSSAGQ